ncbi:MAG TPA: GlsB/YeaQ/YmgE family stress response membrane protein [Polyangiaceae bacterium]|nr:GlsB/YeaQ/YmgE family stress response membrane protein [Polyangiaceae bacterium]
MSIIWFIIIGIIAGYIARALMPGRQSMGFIATALLGIAGSFVGGFLASLIGGGRILDLNTSGIIGSIIGALVVLAIMAIVAKRRPRATV